MILTEPVKPQFATGSTIDELSRWVLIKIFGVFFDNHYSRKKRVW